jgi:pyruvate,water dikinase
MHPQTLVSRAAIGPEVAPHGQAAATIASGRLVPPFVRGGTPVSRGRYTGWARLVDVALDPDALQPGEVAIVLAGGVSCLTAVVVAGALVLERGGPLCSLAIVARELGIPAVAAVGPALTQVATGDWVEVDGAAGTVTVRSRARRATRC